MHGCTGSCDPFRALLLTDVPEFGGVGPPPSRRLTAVHRLDPPDETMAAAAAGELGLLREEGGDLLGRLLGGLVWKVMTGRDELDS